MRSALNGKPVPSDVRCVFCGRFPRPDEKYGTGEKDWDAPGRICPECWDQTFKEKELVT